MNNPYFVHREYDPNPSPPAAVEYVKPADEEVADIRRQLEQRRKALNARDKGPSLAHVEAAIDAMLRGGEEPTP